MILDIFKAARKIQVELDDSEILTNPEMLDEQKVLKFRRQYNRTRYCTNFVYKGCRQVLFGLDRQLNELPETKQKEVCLVFNDLKSQVVANCDGVDSTLFNLDPNGSNGQFAREKVATLVATVAEANGVSFDRSYVNCPTDLKESRAMAEVDEERLALAFGEVQQQFHDIHSEATEELAAIQAGLSLILPEVNVLGQELLAGGPLSEATTKLSVDSLGDTPVDLRKVNLVGHYLFGGYFSHMASSSQGLIALTLDKVRKLQPTLFFRAVTLRDPVVPSAPTEHSLPLKGLFSQLDSENYHFLPVSWESTFPLLPELDLDIKKLDDVLRFLNEAINAGSESMAHELFVFASGDFTSSACFLSFKFFPLLLPLFISLKGMLLNGSSVVSDLNSIPGLLIPLVQIVNGVRVAGYLFFQPLDFPLLVEVLSKRYEEELNTRFVVVSRLLWFALSTGLTASSQGSFLQLPPNVGELILANPTLNQEYGVFKQLLGLGIVSIDQVMPISAMLSLKKLLALQKGIYSRSFNVEEVVGDI